MSTWDSQKLDTCNPTTEILTFDNKYDNKKHTLQLCNVLNSSVADTYIIDENNETKFILLNTK